MYGSTYSPAASLVRATGAVTITVPENCVSIKSILPVSQSQLDAGLSFLIVRTDNVDYKSARRRASATFIRTYYCVFEGLTTLRFAPALQEAVNLSLVYVALPQRVDFNTVIDGIPEAAYQALLVYAGYRALWSIKHEDVNVAYQMWQAERKELLEILKGNFEKINFHGKRANNTLQNMMTLARSGKVEKRLSDINKLS